VNTPGVIINHISLTRYHEPVDTTTVAAKDSLAADSAKVAVDSVLTMDKKVDSVQVAEPTQDGPTRMNPRDMKENNRQQNNARPQRIKRRN